MIIYLLFFLLVRNRIKWSYLNNFFWLIWTCFWSNICWWMRNYIVFRYGFKYWFRWFCFYFLWLWYFTLFCNILFFFLKYYLLNRFWLLLFISRSFMRGFLFNGSFIFIALFWFWWLFFIFWRWIELFSGSWSFTL